VTGVQTDVLVNTTQIELVGRAPMIGVSWNADCGTDGQGNSINCNLPCTNAAQVNAADYQPTCRIRCAARLSHRRMFAGHRLRPSCDVRYRAVGMYVQVKPDAALCQLIQSDGSNSGQ
jgi:hypothetical protein